MKQKQLYKFTRPEWNKFGAPRLIPVNQTSSATGGAGNISNLTTQYQKIDVIHDFQWTSSPRSARQEIPELFLKEKRLVANTYVAQAAYYTAALTGVASDMSDILKTLSQSGIVGSVLNGLIGAGIGTEIANATVAAAGGGGNIGIALGALIGAAGGPEGAIAGGVAGQAAGGAIESLAAAGGGLAGMAIGGSNISNMIAGGMEGVLKQIGSLPRLNNFTTGGFKSKELTPYVGLYITEDTNFLYRFPYLMNDYAKVRNSFSDTPPADAGSFAGSFANISDKLGKIAYQVSSNINFNSPGVYLEKPKFFNFAQDGETINVKFPLINTGWSTYQDVLLNWQLLYLLVYQNRANRRSRDLIDPPVLYELTIPGQRFHPYVYINELSISFLGSTRLMQIDVPYEKGTILINAIIPEAYDVTIQFKELTSSTQNFLFASLSDQAKITTGYTQSITDQLNTIDSGRAGRQANATTEAVLNQERAAAEAANVTK